MIDNYPEGQVEYMEVPNNQENPELWNKKSTVYKRIIYRKEKILWKNRQKKYFRMFPGNESAPDERIFCNLYRL